MHITMGNSRYSTDWKTSEMSFEQLAQEFSTVKVSPDKDVGGAIAGYLLPGHTRRKKSSVDHSDMVILDADNAGKDFTDVLLKSKWIYHAYTTRSSTEEEPRWRVVLPLSRAIDADEYEIVSRQVALDLGKERICGSTFHINQLMYFPSRAEGAPEPRIATRITGDPVNVDEMLARPMDWTLWGKTVSSGKLIHRDPTEARNLAGAFCRVYSMSDGLSKFLSDYYESTDDPVRWTWLEGTSQMGLVIYDDKLAFSHHGTDPAADGHCHSIFDLICLHKFHGKYGACCEWIRQNEPEVVTEDAVSNAFDDEDHPDFTEYGFKMSDFQSKTKTVTIEKKDGTTKTQTVPGKITANLRTAREMILRSTVLKDIRFDELRNRLVVQKHLPWRKVGDWEDEDIISLRSYFNEAYGLDFKKVDLEAGINEWRNKRRFNSLQDRLNSFKWDGQKRIEDIFIKLLGVKDTPLTRAMTQKFFAGCIQKAYSPIPVKQDCVLILTGPTGIGKSTIIRKLGMEWWTDEIIISDIIDRKKAFEKMQNKGIWIAELGEMAGLRKADQESIKSFLSATSDQARFAYAKNVTELKRMASFIGTSNRNDLLFDETGARRFWILECTTGALKDIFAYDPEQFWAEARECLMKEELFLNAAQEAEANKEREQFYAEDTDEATVRTFLKIPNADGTKRTYVTTRDIWMDCFHGEFGKMTPSKEATRIGRMLHHITGKGAAFQRIGDEFHRAFKL